MGEIKYEVPLPLSKLQLEKSAVPQNGNVSEGNPTGVRGISLRELAMTRNSEKGC